MSPARASIVIVFFDMLTSFSQPLLHCCSQSIAQLLNIIASKHHQLAPGLLDGVADELLFEGLAVQHRDFFQGAQ